MASTISGINDSLTDQQVVGALRYVLPFFGMFSYKLEPEGKIKNDVIYVPIASDPSAQSKTAGTIVSGDGTLAGTTVTLSNFYGAGWDAKEGEMRGSLMASYWADKAAGAVYVLAKQVIDAALALVTAGNFGDVAGTDKYVKAAADFDQAALAQFVKVGVKKAKQREITMLLNTEYAFALMGQSLFALTFAASGNNVLASGNLPPLLGIPAARYDELPTNSENLAGAIFGRAAVCAAVAPPDPLMTAGQGDIVDRRLITEPDSGLSALYTVTASGGGIMKGEVSLLYGVAKGRDAAARLCSA